MIHRNAQISCKMLSQITHTPVFHKIQEGKGEAYLPVLTEHFPHSQVTFQSEIQDFSSKAFYYIVLCVPVCVGKKTLSSQKNEIINVMQTFFHRLHINWIVPCNGQAIAFLITLNDDTVLDQVLA